MSAQERIRLDAMKRIERKELTVTAAAQLIDLSLRQTRRLWKRFKADGDAGLVHRLRSRVGNRRLGDADRQRIVKRHQESYADFGPTLACEKLAGEGLVLSPNTLTALLKERGLWQRRRRRGKHRQRRQRRACFGSMVQMDGSHHDWFEGRGPWCVLMVMIDDATNQTLARFFPAETTAAAFDVVRRWAERRGLPRSLYVDRHAIYRDEDHPGRPTQFGRAMKELGVELILAHSPQAKGRVERRHAVFQDRLVKEMRLRGIGDLAAANALLEHSFLAELNARLAVQAARAPDLHRPVGAGLALERVLCVVDERVVGHDWCVRWRGRWLQVEARHASLSLPRRRVTVRELASGVLLLDHRGEALTFTELSGRPEPATARRPVVNNRRWKPAADHPWKRKAAEPVSATPRVAPCRVAQATPSRRGRAKVLDKSR
jgi:hypothetical protein